MPKYSNILRQVQNNENITGGQRAEQLNQAADNIDETIRQSKYENKGAKYSKIIKSVADAGLNLAVEMDKVAASDLVENTQEKMRRKMAELEGLTAAQIQEKLSAGFFKDIEADFQAGSEKLSSSSRANAQKSFEAMAGKSLFNLKQYQGKLFQQEQATKLSKHLTNMASWGYDNPGKPVNLDSLRDKYKDILSTKELKELLSEGEKVILNAQLQSFIDDKNIPGIEGMRKRLRKSGHSDIYINAMSKQGVLSAQAINEAERLKQLKTNQNITLFKLGLKLEDQKRKRINFNQGQEDRVDKKKRQKRGDEIREESHAMKVEKHGWGKQNQAMKVEGFYKKIKDDAKKAVLKSGLDINHPAKLQEFITNTKKSGSKEMEAYGAAVVNYIANTLSGNVVPGSLDITMEKVFEKHYRADAPKALGNLKSAIKKNPRDFYNMINPGQDYDTAVPNEVKIANGLSVLGENRAKEVHTAITNLTKAGDAQGARALVSQMAKNTHSQPWQVMEELDEVDIGKPGDEGYNAGLAAKAMISGYGVFSDDQLTLLAKAKKFAPGAIGSKNTDTSPLVNLNQAAALNIAETAEAIVAAQLAHDGTVKPGSKEYTKLFEEQANEIIKQAGKNFVENREKWYHISDPDKEFNRPSAEAPPGIPQNHYDQLDSSQQKNVNNYYATLTPAGIANNPNYHESTRENAKAAKEIRVIRDKGRVKTVLVMEDGNIIPAYNADGNEASFTLKDVVNGKQPGQAILNIKNSRVGSIANQKKWPKMQIVEENYDGSVKDSLGWKDDPIAGFNRAADVLHKKGWTEEELYMATKEKVIDGIDNKLPQSSIEEIADRNRATVGILRELLQRNPDMKRTLSEMPIAAMFRYSRMLEDQPDADPQELLMSVLIKQPAGKGVGLAGVLTACEEKVVNRQELIGNDWKSKPYGLNIDPIATAATRTEDDAMSEIASRSCGVADSLARMTDLDPNDVANTLNKQLKQHSFWLDIVEGE